MAEKEFYLTRNDRQGERDLTVERTEDGILINIRVAYQGNNSFELTPEEARKLIAWLNESS